MMMLLIVVLGIVFLICLIFVNVKLCFFIILCGVMIVLKWVLGVLFLGGLIIFLFFICLWFFVIVGIVCISVLLSFIGFD